VKNRLSIILFFVFWALSLMAQKQVISGKIIDAGTKEPVPFTNIYFQKSLKGTVSNIDGKFSIEYDGTKDSLVFSAVGYRTQTFCPSKIKQKRLNVKLKQINIQIKEVRVKPRKTRAHELLRLIHEHEKENNTYYFKGIEGDEYNRVSIMFSRIDNKIKDNRLFKKTQGAFIDESDSTCSVPVLMSEDVGHFLLPADGSERIVERINEKKIGLDIFDGADMTDITDEMTTNQNFYKQFIPLLGKNFASPTFVNARFYYKMWVSDSVIVNNMKQIRVDFRPKRKKDLAFYGYFWVEDSSFAITDIYVELSPKANINYIRGIRIHNVYEKTINNKWYFKNKYTELIFDYTPGTDTLKKVTTYVSKVSSYRNLKATDKNFLHDNLVAAKGAAQLKQPNVENSDEFWAQNRFVELDSTERQIYASIDTLKNNKFIQAFDKTVNMFLTGYWTSGKIDYGPYLDFYRRNKLEGHRVTLAMRTSRFFKENYTFGGYLGYGFKDKKAKYGVKARYKLNWRLYSVVGVDVWYDVKKIGDNENLKLVKENSYSSGEDNLISAVTSINPNDKLSEKKYAGGWFEHDLKNGITTKFKLFTSRTYESPYVRFIHDNNNVDYINQFAGSVNLRLSFKENYLNEYFKRVYLGNKYPIFNINTEFGICKTDYTQNPYLKLHATMKHKLRLGMGFIKYLFEAGKIFGDVPFPMLEIHRGNETFGMARYNFNMLNYLEYASDTYVNFHGTYNFGGIIFNHIPLLRVLNLREVISFKGILGNLSDRHRAILDYPTGMSKVVEPYAEIGIGITNIGQYGRIEYVWRLSDRNKPGIMLEGIRFRFEAGF